MRLVVARDAGQLAEIAAELFRDRVRARPELAMAVPAGRTPRRMYRVLQALQATAPVDYSRMRVFSVDELCPPAPVPEHDGDGLADFLVYRPKPDARRAFRILRTDRGFRVVGRPPGEEELERALRDAGAKRGDEVEVAGEALEFQ